MDRFYQDRISARRILLDQIAEIDRLSVAEIDAEAKSHKSPSLAENNVKNDVLAAQSADFLSDGDGMPT